ncbi:putative retrotransposon hot spot protein (RHS) [Trypanosoma cruzi]|uniref:Putative retrotransposon hot spot protein (RHS) n=1 Tax=Trypanosoma cruzi TaxID=5693 RepID=A0A2V2V392_TRYCR|nr:putative retrotransposon hot spot protein (RHS) [Trypanosoma cruzi]
MRIYASYAIRVSTIYRGSLAAAEAKAAVYNSTKHFLDAAAEEARNPTTTSAPEKLEGCYESVYNARWHHVVEIPDGVERKKTGTGMEVHEGKPEQTWSYREADDAVEKDDAVQQFGAAPPVLMLLASRKGWPYSWEYDTGSSQGRSCKLWGGSGVADRP